MTDQVEEHPEVEMAPEQTSEPKPTPTPPVQNRTMTIRFNRKVQPKQYETVDCGAEATFDVPDSYPMEKLATLVEDEYTKLRSAVYQQLGIAFTYDEGTRTLIEAFGPETTVVQAAAAPAQGNAFAGTGFQPAPTTPAAVQGSPFAAAAPAPAADAGPPPGWADLQANPGNWKDNRAAKRSEKSPDFIHLTAKKVDGQGKTRDVALWLNSQYDPCPPEIRQAMGI